MDNKKIVQFNNFINKGYECLSFTEFLKLAIMNLHDFVMYDSGMFYCETSKDCSFFKPYLGGSVNDYYNKQEFKEKDQFLRKGKKDYLSNRSNVYKSSDYKHGLVCVEDEPRNSFLDSQEDFNIACTRIVYDGRFLGEIYLHRSKDKPDFDDDELFILSLMQPHISTIFNIIHTITVIKYVESNNKPNSAPGVCIFDLDMCLSGGNNTGVEMLKVCTIHNSSILYHIKEISSEMIVSNLCGGESVDYFSTTIKTQNGGLKIKIYFDKTEKNDRDNMLIVVMQYSDKSELAEEYKYKFTKRQADIIDGLIQGKNNLQLASNLHISENTVKTHIKNIYKKTGTNNRTELSYVLMLNKSEICN